MNAAVVPTLAQLALGIAAFCCLALAMERHARQAGVHVKPRRQKVLRWAGWALLAIALFLAVSSTGWGFGLVSLFGVLSVAMLVVIALITYRSRWLVPASVVCVISGSGLLAFCV